MQRVAGHGRRNLLLVTLFVLLAVSLVGSVSSYFGHGGRLAGATALAIAVGTLAQLLGLGRPALPFRSCLVVYFVGAMAVVDLISAGVSEHRAFTWVIVAAVGAGLGLILAGVAVSARRAAREPDTTTTGTSDQ